MVFAVGPPSILIEFSLANSMEPVGGLERASKPAPQVNKSFAKKVIKNLKCNKCKSGKLCDKSSAPKLAPSLALELAKTSL